MLLLAQGPPTLVPMQCWYCLKTGVLMRVKFFLEKPRKEKSYHNIPGFFEKNHQIK
jgi:hypothetical protein